MGHYYAEMMCKRCGNLRCTCPPSPDTSLNKWVLNNGTPMLAREFDKIYPHPQRLFLKHYITKEDADQAAEAWRLERIETIKATIRSLTTELHALWRRAPKP